MIKSKHVNLYEIGKRLFRFDTMVYSLQHLIFGVANAAAVPIVVGTALGLDASGIGAFAQRTFFFAGIACLLQALFGHKYPIFEGPAGVWYTTFVVLAGIATDLGNPLATLRTDIMMGMLAAGVLSILLGALGLMQYVRKLFTPVVNSTFLIVMALQFTSTISRGLLSMNNGRPVLDSGKLLVFFIAISTTLFLSLKAKGFVQSVAVLIGTTAGWVTAYFVGLAPVVNTITVGPSPIFQLPQLFAWGRPTFDIGVCLTAIMAGMVVLSNLVASVVGMNDLHDRQEVGKVFNRTVICTGIADILAALGAIVGFVPYASSIGFAALTGILDLLPFIIGSILLTFLGIIPSVGSFFAAMPITVGYAVMFSVFTMILGMGIKDASKSGIYNRKIIILGSSVLVGNGISFIPSLAFSTLPAGLSYLFANGLIVAVLLALLLEHVIFREKKQSVSDAV